MINENFYPQITPWDTKDTQISPQITKAVYKEKSN